MTLFLLSLYAIQSRAQGIAYHGSQLDIHLSRDVETAVQNGIPLTFICEYAMISTFAFLHWRHNIKRHHFVVKHHALSDSYLVTSGTASSPRIFRSMSDTMRFVSEQAETIFASYHSLDGQHQMRVKLSKTDLPGPMRFNAFIAATWDLDSGWKTWESAR